MSPHLPSRKNRDDVAVSARVERLAMTFLRNYQNSLGVSLPAFSSSLFVLFVLFVEKA